MAIKNSDGNYLRVVDTRMVPEYVAVELYRNEDLRQTGPGPFDQVVQDHIFCDLELREELAVAADPAKSVRDNVTTACYRALKRMPQFVGWVDC
jgi:hypothetical protein